MIEEQTPNSQEFQARIINLRQEAGKALGLLPEPMMELKAAIERIDNPLALIDIIASTLDLPLEEKQELLAVFDPEQRSQKVSEKLARQISLLELSKKIGEETKGSLDKAQRQYFLREQLRAIQKELGEDSGENVEVEELRNKIQEAKMPPPVEAEVLRELSRFERMPEMAAERSMIRTYLDWMVELPWSVSSEEQIELPRAREILDADHYDLEKVKKRIVEFLAVRKLNPEGKSPILCFVGPPGVGKTSLGQSIARATDRKFQRVALGGTHDEAEIRGHRRTYIGALPGNIISAVKRAESRAGVIMLDEVDKLGMGGFHGDPSSALLEVLDPEQNSKFRDNYLGVDFDLSKVMFITTANMLDTIPGPLRDRMEIIQLPGYTEEEKLEIAKRYLVKRQLEANGLDSSKVEITEEAIKRIISDYTREAGVRTLEREMGAVLRNTAMKIAEGFSGKIEI